MIALGVPHAATVNKASEMYGVSPALIQGILDVADPSLPTLPAAAVDYAKQYAAANDIPGDATLSAEAVIMAIARYLWTAFSFYGGQWRAIEQFYGGGPRGRIAMIHLSSGPYETRRRQWGE